MKVELVKVKINKLKEVKKQLRKRKCSTKNNLKNLLLENEKKERKDNIIYRSINALFEDDKDFNETIHCSTYSDSPATDYHIDLEDVLENLGNSQNDLSQEHPSGSLSISEQKDERADENTNLTVENSSLNSSSYTLNLDNGEIQGDEINLCDDVEMFLFNNSESTLNLYDTQLEPEMLELGNYYIPDTIFETSNDTRIEMDEFCNQVEISITEDPNKEDIHNQTQHSEADNPVDPNLNNDLYDEETNDHTGEISNPSMGVAMINPLLVNIPEVDLQTMALYQLQQKNDPEVNNLGETELLKNYNWEQKANIIAAAKMLYTKRTRTLLHWLDPKLSLTRLRATLELSWENLPLWQKEVYISQVMGPLVVEPQNTPMLNPQLKSVNFKKSAPTSKKSQYERKKFSDFITNV